MSQLKNTSNKIFVEQVRILYSNSTVPMLVSVVAGSLLCWSLWDIINRTTLVLWFSVFFCISTVRVLLLRSFKTRKPGRGNTGHWHSRFLIGTYAVAALWGAASLFLFPVHSPQAQIVFFLFLTGLSAAAVSSLCPSLPIVSGFLSLVLIPLAIKVISLGHNDSLFIGLLIVLFWVVLLAGAIKLNRNIRENIQLRLQSIDRERVLKASQESYQHIFNNAPLGIFHYDTKGTIIECNRAFAAILGSTQETLIGFNMLTSIKNRGVLSALKDSLAIGKGNGFFEGEYNSVTSGKTIPVRALFNAIRATDQTIVGGVGILEDFTEKKLSEQQIHYHTTYDALTGLPNRRLLLNQLSNEISRARRHGRYGALLFLDLDNFKTINDSLGHSVGDELLKIVAQRLADNLRHEDSIARMGGDEFIMILTELDTVVEIAVAKARNIAEKLRSSLSAPCRIEGHEMHITPSIGISLFPKSGLENDDILKQADTAMYKAKAAGRNEIRFFLPKMQEAADERLRLSTDIRKALQTGEFAVWYQPQVDRSGTIIGAEALVRWHHPDRGMVFPGDFLPIAEETGLMWDIGQWVLTSACEHIKAWENNQLIDLSMSISVNISGKEFGAPAFVDAVTTILEKNGINPLNLGIELTEGSLVSTGRDIIGKIITLRELGITFSVDDFGTGYSSLTYLKDLPLNTLKIDRSFVSEIETSEESVVLIDTIIMMAKNMNLDVIAEGVETEQQLTYLSDRGCTAYQGYYFSRPVDHDTFTEMLKSKHCRA